MKTDIGILDKNRQAVAVILNRVLSDEFLLYAKTRNFHWNVTGESFSELHKFFEAQYEELDDILDEVAERSRALGVRASGSLKEFLDQTQLKESIKKSMTSKQMLQELLLDHESVIRSLRQDLDAAANEYKDAGTSDFLTGVMEQHEKMAWMLRAYLE